MEGIKIFKESDKLKQAYDLLVEKIDGIVEHFQLTYFELWGIIEALKSDLIKVSIREEEEE